jgi:outer membrane biosynthesis protein TonB
MVPDQDRQTDVHTRRSREQRVWGLAFIFSVGLHVLIFLLGPLWLIDLSSLPAAGSDRADDLALTGFLEAVAMSSAPPDAAQPPPVPVPDVILPDPVEPPPEVPPEVELDVPEVPEPGTGLTTGTDAEEVSDAGVPGAPGDGAAGTEEEGVSRLIPPSPRGMILPPTNRDLRGRQVEVWVFVNEQGRVVPDSTQLRPPTPDRRFNEQLEREAAQWVFEPAREGGLPVAAWFPYLISME